MSAISETYNLWYFGIWRCLTKCFFHSKWNGAWLLLVKMVNSSWLTSCQAMWDWRKSQNSMELKCSVQSSSKNQNIVNNRK